jgi:hypothetical protein
MIFNNTGLTKDNIIFDFDISNIKSFDNNAGFSVTSLTFWENYILSDLTLTGYGQTMYDFGLATSLTETKTFTRRDRNLILQRLGYNDSEGNTTFPQINLSTGITEGNSLSLSGGYLSTFFKLDGKNYQLAKYRTENGFTIDTWLYIDQHTFDNINSFTDGFFLYLGAKSENKFNIAFSGANDDTSKISYDTNNYIQDLEYNAAGLKFNDDKTISLRYLITSGFAAEYKSDNPIETTGWTNIVTTFRYCKKIKDYNSGNLIDCTPRRDGSFKIFVNGKLFHEVDNTEEFFWLRPLSIESDKQIGIPFTINWGGGTWGLKHSYVDGISSLTYTQNIITGRTFEYITGYTLENTSGYVYNLVTGQTLFSGGTFGTFESSSITGVTSDVFNSLITTSSTRVYSGNTSLLLTYTDYTAYTFSSATSKNLLKFNDKVEIKPNKKYIFNTKLYDNDSFYCYNNKLSLGFFENLNSENIVVTSVTYSDNPKVWSDLILEFITPQVITGLTSYTPVVKLQDITAATRLYRFYFDNFKFDEYDILITGGTNQIKYGDTNIITSTITGVTTDVLNNIFTTTFVSGNSILSMNIIPTAITTSATFNLSSNLIGDIYNLSNVNTQIYNASVEISADHPYQCSTTLKLFNTSASTIPYTSDTNNLLLFNPISGITILPDKKYVYSAKFYDDNSYSGVNKSVFLTFSGSLNSEVTILTSKTYDNTVDKRKWVDLYLEFSTPSAITGNTTYFPTVKIDNTSGLNSNYKFYFDDVSLIQYTPAILQNIVSTSGLTFSATGDNLLIFNSVNLIPDRKYIYKGKFYDENSYNTGQTKGVYLALSGNLDSENTIVSSLTYTTSTSANTWVDLRLEFFSPKTITGLTSYIPVIKFNNLSGIKRDYKFYFDEFSFERYRLTGDTNYFLDGNNGTFENNIITGVTSNVLNIIITSSTAVTYSGNYSLKLKNTEPITSITYLSGYVTSYTYFFNTGTTIGFESGSTSGVSTNILDVVITSTTAQTFSGFSSLLLSASSSSTKTIFKYISGGTILYNFEGSISGFTTEISAATLTSSTEQFSNKYYSSATSLKLFGDASGITITTGLTLYSGNVITNGNSGTFEYITPLDIDTNNTAAYFFELSPVLSGSVSLRVAPYPQQDSYAPFFSIDKNLFYFIDEITLQPNSIYYYEGYVYDFTSSTQNTFVTAYTGTNSSGNVINISAYTKNIAQTFTGSNKGIYLDTIPPLNPEITILSAQTYTSTTSANTWAQMKVAFKTPAVMTGATKYKFSTSIDHEDELAEPSTTTLIFTGGTSGESVTSLTIYNQGYQFFFDNYYLYYEKIDSFSSFTLSSTTDVLVKFSSFTITTNTQYFLNTEFYDNNSYLTGQDKGVKLEISGGLNSENIIISSLTYTTTTSANTWTDLTLAFTTPSALTGSTTYTPIAKLYNKSGISSEYKFYFDNFTITNYPLTPITSFTFSSTTNSLLTLSAITPQINKKYVLGAKFYDNNSYNSGETKGVYIGFIPPLDEEHNVVSSITYTTTTSANTWNDLKIDINTPILQITGNTSYTPYIFIENPSGINQNYKFYFDEIYVEDYNLLPVVSLSGFSYVISSSITKTFETSVENVSSNTINGLLQLSSEEKYSGNSSLKLSLNPLVITQFTANTLTINDANFGEFENSGHTSGVTSGLTIDIVGGLLETIPFSEVGNPSAFVLNVRNVDLTGNTYSSATNTIFSFTNQKTILPNKLYQIESRFNDFFSFVGHHKNVELNFLNLNPENQVIGKTAYTDSNSFNTWYTLRTEIRTPSAITGNTSYTLGAIVDFEDCPPSIYNFRFDNFKLIEQDVITGLTYSSATNNIFVFENINITTNKKYVLSTNFYDDNSYLSGESKNVYFDFIPSLSNDNTVLTSITYTTSTSSNTWVDLRIEFTTPTALTSTTSYTPVIKIDNPTAITESYKFYIDNYNFETYDLLPDYSSDVTIIPFSSNTNNLLTFDNELEIKPNKRYILDGYFYDNNGYYSGSEKGIYFNFINPLNSEIEILSSTTYTTTTSANTWVYLSIDFVTPIQITGLTSYTPVIKFENPTGITYYYNFYFDEIKFRQYDVIQLTGLSSYTLTNEILYNRGVKSIIKDNFDGSFYGKIQKLRMYDIDLQFPEIKKNYNFHSTKYGFTKLK